MVEFNKKVYCESCKSVAKKINFGFSYFRNFNYKNRAKYFCYNCQYVFMFPGPSLSELDIIYKEQYREQTQVSFGKKNANFPTGLDWSKYSFLRFDNFKKSIIDANIKIESYKSLIDIGGYQGAFASAVKQIFPYLEVFVSDLDKTGLKMAKSLFDLGIVNFNSLYENNFKYDIITQIHVFEHVPNFNLHLQNIKKLLSPNGLIYFEVPNFLNFPFTDKTHIYEYSEFFLDELFRKNNLTVLNIRSNQGPKLPTSTFIEYCTISILATNKILENNKSKNFKRYNYLEIKIKHFVNDILLILRSIFTSFLSIIKHFFYLSFTLVSFIFPSISKFILKIIGRL